ncbi:MAG TPA: ferredoxin [Holophaga sp.]|nr:ferredoxin [Holophaga sp.]HPS67448.1 ferredoxin [Holophaga sp.]
MAIKVVWIEDGCIMCNACEAECPDVFVVSDTSSTIRAGARQDGRESENRQERSPLKVELQAPMEAGIESAAAGCPAQVIRFEKA